MAILELAADFGDMRAFAPGGDQRHAEHLLEKAAICFVISGNPGVVMQAKR